MGHPVLWLALCRWCFRWHYVPLRLTLCLGYTNIMCNWDWHYVVGLRVLCDTQNDIMCLMSRHYVPPRLTLCLGCMTIMSINYSGSCLLILERVKRFINEPLYITYWSDWCYVFVLKHIMCYSAWHYAVGAKALCVNLKCIMCLVNMHYVPRRLPWCFGCMVIMSITYYGSCL